MLMKAIKCLKKVAIRTWLFASIICIILPFLQLSYSPHLDKDDNVEYEEEWGWYCTVEKSGCVVEVDHSS